AKKNKPFTINFTEDELNEIRLEAQKLKMNVSQYMRFKIFNT
ncbi:plasmid mobilization protein, partial [Helicobacter trogontum]